MNSLVTSVKLICLYTARSCWNAQAIELMTFVYSMHCHLYMRACARAGVCERACVRA